MREALLLAASLLFSFSLPLGRANAAAEPCGSVVLPAAIGLSSQPTAIQTLHPVLMTGTIAEQNAIDLVFEPLIRLEDEIDPARGLAATRRFASVSSQNGEGDGRAAMDALLDRAIRQDGTAPLCALERAVVAAQPMIVLPDGDATLLIRRGLRGMNRLIGPNSEFSPQTLTLAQPLNQEGAMACDAPHA